MTFDQHLNSLLEEISSISWDEFSFFWKMVFFKTFNLTQFISLIGLSKGTDSVIQSILRNCAIEIKESEADSEYQYLSISGMDGRTLANSPLFHKLYKFIKAGDFKVAKISIDPHLYDAHFYFDYIVAPDTDWELKDLSYNYCEFLEFSSHTFYRFLDDCEYEKSFSVVSEFSFPEIYMYGDEEEDLEEGSSNCQLLDAFIDCCLRMSTRARSIKFRRPIRDIKLLEEILPSLPLLKTLKFVFQAGSICDNDSMCNMFASLIEKYSGKYKFEFQIVNNSSTSPVLSYHDDMSKLISFLTPFSFDQGYVLPYIPYLSLNSSGLPFMGQLAMLSKLVNLELDLGTFVGTLELTAKSVKRLTIKLATSRNTKNSHIKNLNNLYYLRLVRCEIYPGLFSRLPQSITELSLENCTQAMNHQLFKSPYCLRKLNVVATAESVRSPIFSNLEESALSHVSLMLYDPIDQSFLKSLPSGLTSLSIQLKCRFARPIDIWSNMNLSCLRTVTELTIEDETIDEFDLSILPPNLRTLTFKVDLINQFSHHFPRTLKTLFILGDIYPCFDFERLNKLTQNCKLYSLYVKTDVNELDLDSFNFKGLNDLTIDHRTPGPVHVVLNKVPESLRSFIFVNSVKPFTLENTKIVLYSKADIGDFKGCGLLDCFSSYLHRSDSSDYKRARFG